MVHTSSGLSAGERNFGVAPTQLHRLLFAVFEFIQNNSPLTELIEYKYGYSSSTPKRHYRSLLATVMHRYATYSGSQVAI